MTRLFSGQRPDSSCAVGFRRKRTVSFAELHSAVRVVGCLMKRLNFDEKQMKAIIFNVIRFFILSEQCSGSLPESCFLEMSKGLTLSLNSFRRLAKCSQPVFTLDGDIRLKTLGRHGAPQKPKSLGLQTETKGQEGYNRPQQSKLTQVYWTSAMIYVLN